MCSTAWPLHAVPMWRGPAARRYFGAAVDRQTAATRVLRGFSVFGDGNTEDCHGHGTHTAGIVGGACERARVYV
jgi:hypothetical protein